MILTGKIMTHFACIDRLKQGLELKMFMLMFDRKCSADILSSVDNYALLCLDVVWCYLRLQNISSLPDAGVCLFSAVSI
jgi:hypothetical protein